MVSTRRTKAVESATSLPNPSPKDLPDDANLSCLEDSKPLKPPPPPAIHVHSSLAEIAFAFIAPAVVEYLVGTLGTVGTSDISSPLVDFPSLGNLASVSKDLASGARSSSLFRPLYSTLVSGASSTYDYPRGRMRNTDRISRTSWLGEDNILNLFSEESVLSAHAGVPAAFFRGVGMLLSQTCQLCDGPSNGGSIFALKRLCKACSGRHQQSFAVGPSHIDGFMLTKGELKKAGVEPIPIALEAKSQPFTTKELYSVKQLERASLAKYKTAAGVQEAGTAKKEKAKRKYDDSQSTDKPMKKRSKIESITVYNGNLDDMQRRFMADFYNVLPLGFVNRDSTPPRLEWCYSEKQRHSSSFMFRADLLVHFLDIRELKANITNSAAKVEAKAKELGEKVVKETTTGTTPFGQIITTTKTTETTEPPVQATLSYSEIRDKYNKNAAYPIDTPFTSYRILPQPDHPLNFAEVTPAPQMYGGAKGSLRHLAPRAFYEGEESHTSTSNHGLQLNIRRSVAVVKLGPWDFFLDFEERSVPGYWRNSTKLFCYREDCKGVPLCVLDFDDDVEQTTTWNNENCSPSRLHARLLRDLELADGVMASDVFGAVLALLTSGNETRWKKSLEFIGKSARRRSVGANPQRSIIEAALSAKENMDDPMPTMAWITASGVVPEAPTATTTTATTIISESV